MFCSFFDCVSDSKFLAAFFLFCECLIQEEPLFSYPSHICRTPTTFWPKFTDWITLVSLYLLMWEPTMNKSHEAHFGAYVTTHAVSILWKRPFQVQRSVWSQCYITWHCSDSAREDHSPLLHGGGQSASRMLWNKSMAFHVVQLLELLQRSAAYSHMLFPAMHHLRFQEIIKRGLYYVA